LSLRPPKSASYQQGGAFPFRDSLALILFLATLRELLLLLRIPIPRTPVNKGKILRVEGALRSPGPYAEDEDVD